MVPVKRIELFIDSLYFLKKSNFKFESIWIGDGILKNELIKRNNKKNIPVQFLGKLSKKNVLKELKCVKRNKKFSYILHPSITSSSSYIVCIGKQYE